ncbi:MAG: flagellar hook-associated protein FlgK, partial [Proteobacteria bacterium]|nr:flagellar hook-associated protein FlgK [Pseudomonadota bacterium]
SMAKLQNSMTMGGTATFGNFYQSLMSEVGNSVQYASNNLSNHTAMVDQLSNYRESISGVSLDEEMVNLVKFQHAYSAAAKLISVVDEMLDTLLRLA